MKEKEASFSSGAPTFSNNGLLASQATLKIACACAYTESELN